MQPFRTKRNDPLIQITGSKFRWIVMFVLIFLKIIFVKLGHNERNDLNMNIKVWIKMILKKNYGPKWQFNV